MVRATFASLTRVFVDEFPSRYQREKKKYMEPVEQQKEKNEERKRKRRRKKTPTCAFGPTVT